MKKHITEIIISINALALFILFVINGCSKNAEPITKDTRNCIVIKGSDTEYKMVKFIAEDYKKEVADVRINVSSEGSSLGINAFIHGESDIANSSRPLTPEEKDLAAKRGVKPMQIIFAMDAIAIITNSRLGIDSLSLHQLSQVYSGDITNWKDVGGPDEEIHLYGRDHSSGTRKYLKDKIIRAEYKQGISQLRGNSEILKAIENDRNGIGYVGVGYLMDENEKPVGSVWAMPLYVEGQRAYSPYELTSVNSGDYPLTRPLYQVVNENLSKAIAKFIAFELSPRGQTLVRKFGYFPVNDFHKEINRMQGITH